MGKRMAVLALVGLVMSIGGVWTLAQDESATTSSVGLKQERQPGRNFNVKKDETVTIKITGADKLCWRVAVVSTDDSTTADVTFTHPKGTPADDTQTGLTAGKQTRCICNVESIKITARGGDVVVTYVVCDEQK